jgi:cytochrome P450
VSRARRRDRRVYLRSHPVLFGVAFALRRRPVVRLWRTVLVNGAGEYREALTGLSLDRTAPRSTGGRVRSLGAGDFLFDQDGDAHRRARRDLVELLGAGQIERLRPIWCATLDRRLAPLAAGESVDVVAVAAEVAGATAAALLGVSIDPMVLAAVAAQAASHAVRSELPGPVWPGQGRAALSAARQLAALLDGATVDIGMAGMLAVAAVNTTVAALPRAAAWCADADLWSYASDPSSLPVLAGELLRVIAPSPLLPRVAASAGKIRKCPVRAGDRLILFARHAAGAHAADPDPSAPSPARVAQLVFGAGSHACPGASLARLQMQDFLGRLAPHRPKVTRARASRRAALPAWSSLGLRGRA